MHAVSPRQQLQEPMILHHVACLDTIESVDSCWCNVCHACKSSMAAMAIFIILLQCAWLVLLESLDSIVSMHATTSPAYHKFTVPHELRRVAGTTYNYGALRPTIRNGYQLGHMLMYLAVTRHPHTIFCLMQASLHSVLTREGPFPLELLFSRKNTTDTAFT
jgi:hypothetical protein